MKVYIDLPDFESSYEELTPYMAGTNPSGFLRAIAEDVNNIRNNTIDYIRNTDVEIQMSATVEYVIRAATDHLHTRMSPKTLSSISDICHALILTVLRRIAQKYDWYNYSFKLESYNYGRVRSYGTVTLLLCCTRITEFPESMERDFTRMSRQVTRAMFGIT